MSTLNIEVPKTLTTVQYIKKVIYDSEEGTILTRTPLSWAKIGIFYIIFYACLAGFIAICMGLFFLTLDYRHPKWQLDGSLIGTSPGLGYRPTPTHHSDSSLIWFQSSNQSSYQPYVDTLSQFLKNYHVPGKLTTKTGRIRSCSYTNYPAIGEACTVDEREWGPCNKDNLYNYNRHSPCVFLKLNRIYGWEPDYYDDPKNLPNDMPLSLKRHIASINKTLERQVVWVSCEGDSAPDKEYIGPISYYPRNIQGFPGFYFPYKNADGYLSPLVAVRFEKPTPGIVINVRCRAWAKNIHYNKADNLGSIRFELLIDI